MSYLSLYRKYRSQSFDEVMGQKHITTVLQNAIRMGRISHAYLFCGPRGCGKTSSARLLARALNCLSTDGPTPEPCGVCSLCERIRNGSAMDIIEMDAASETGIDDVREKIIETAMFAPSEARYKVYIIDEVHDLSLKAFDSLLKTIEEPPAHVVFILATTEAHKVPVTVRSRCQRMDFRRGSLQDLAGNLRRVIEAEGIEYETEAVIAIARAAEGSFRDSLSLLEQSLAYTDGKLTADAVHASIGTVGADILDSVVETIASDDLNAAFMKAGELVETGKDVKQSIIALQLHLRDLLVAASVHSPLALPEVSPERFAQLKQQTAQFRPAQLLQMLDVLAATERELRFTNQHRLLIERAFWSILPSALERSKATVAAVPQPRPETRVERPIHARPAPEPAATAERTAPAADTTPPQAATTGDDARFATEVNLDAVRRLWPRVIRRLTQASSSASAVLKGVEVAALEGRFVLLAFPNDFAREKADRPKPKGALEQALAAELGVHGLKVKCILQSAGDRDEEPPSESSPPPMDLLNDLLPPQEVSTPIMSPPAEPSTNGVNTRVASPNKPEATDAHTAFVETVMRELDCLPLEP